MALAPETKAKLARAAALLRADLAKKWTVTSLAKAVAMSRPAFARHFPTAFGEAPMQYLARARMEAAADALATSRARLAEIAPRVGYLTEFALSRAFRRHFGVAPGEYRRHIGARPTGFGRTVSLAA